MASLLRLPLLFLLSFNFASSAHSLDLNQRYRNFPVLSVRDGFNRTAGNSTGGAASFGCVFNSTTMTDVSKHLALSASSIVYPLTALLGRKAGPSKLCAMDRALSSIAGLYHPVGKMGISAEVCELHVPPLFNKFPSPPDGLPTIFREKGAIKIGPRPSRTDALHAPLPPLRPLYGFGERPQDFLPVSACIVRSTHEMYPKVLMTCLGLPECHSTLCRCCPS